MLSTHVVKQNPPDPIEQFRSMILKHPPEKWEEVIAGLDLSNLIINSYELAAATKIKKPLLLRRRLHNLIIKKLPNIFPAKEGFYYVPFYQQEGQQNLLKMLDTLGYSSENNKHNGVCVGLSHTGLRYAFLTNNLLQFNYLVHFIYEFYDQTVIAIKNKNIAFHYEEKNPEKLAQTEIDLQALLHNTVLYQRPDCHSNLFRKHLTQTNVFQVADIIAPEQKAAPDGAFRADSFSGIYSPQELTSYFAVLKKTLCSFFSTSLNFPIVFEIHGSTHGVCFSYDTDTNAWIFLNACQLPIHLVRHDEMAGKLSRALNFSHYSSTANTVFNTTIYTTNQSQPKIKNFLLLLHIDPDFQRLHTISKAKATMKDGYNYYWIDLAGLFGQTARVEKLLMHHSPYSKIIVTAWMIQDFSLLKNIILHAAKHHEGTKIFLKSCKIMLDKTIHEFIDRFTIKELQQILGTESYNLNDLLKVTESCKDIPKSCYLSHIAMKIYRSTLSTHPHGLFTQPRPPTPSPSSAPARPIQKSPT